MLSTVDWITASVALGVHRMMSRAKPLIEMHNRLSLSDKRKPRKPPAGGEPRLAPIYKNIVVFMISIRNPLSSLKQFVLLASFLLSALVK